ncbi:hypothetical protein [Lysinibacillus fusiformis]|uniref:hypothetical protein n=1 Tax=Lysinibacillus fusiformis TaxID=28031 RepID=UPI00263BCEC2|nr:hypothetical protein [Lysinibacillus fusiformis]MDC6267262.1 hypothetical protein [Lysinibacillus sphaericus]MDN4968304.1 hypothetical protein [Lysinibacillus fusiformis]MDN4968478.1 hypothetical protein [Lysinibacillus fusiformis]
MTIVAKIQSEVVIQYSSPEELLSLYDGLIPTNGLEVTNVRGNKLISECSDFHFVELAELTEDGDLIEILKRTPEVKYYLSDNKSFNMSDLIRIDGRGDYSLILMHNNIFLYNAEDLTTIEAGSASSIDEMRKYLNINYPSYEVLRKIKG